MDALGQFFDDRADLHFYSSVPSGHHDNRIKENPTHD